MLGGQSKNKRNVRGSTLSVLRKYRRGKENGGKKKVKVDSAHASGTVGTGKDKIIINIQLKGRLDTIKESVKKDGRRVSRAHPIFTFFFLIKKVELLFCVCARERRAYT